MEKKKGSTIEVLNDPAKMVGMFAAEDVKRTWFEDVTDEDTAEVVVLSRSEMIVPKGTEITKEVAATIAFSIQSGELKEVACSPECRAGRLAYYGNCHQYNAKVKLPKKKLNILLWAQKISQAFDVLVDWFELNHAGDFMIASIAETDNGAYLEGEDRTEAPNDIEENKIYSIKISMITPDGEKEGNRLIVTAPNIDRAEVIIGKRLKEINGGPIQFMLEEVKITSIDVIIPREFTIPYTEEYNGGE